MESIIRVMMAESMATNPVKGNLCHGFSFKQLDDKLSKESGKTCMNPVAKIIPAANDLTMTKRLRSGLSAGTERVTSGRETPIILVTRMETIAMILRGKAFFLLLQLSFSSEPQSSTTDRTWTEKWERIMKKMEKTTTILEVIDLFELKSVRSNYNEFELKLLYCFTGNELKGEEIYRKTKRGIMGDDVIAD